MDSLRALAQQFHQFAINVINFAPPVRDVHEPVVGRWLLSSAKAPARCLSFRTRSFSGCVAKI